MSTNSSIFSAPVNCYNDWWQLFSFCKSDSECNDLSSVFGFFFSIYRDCYLLGTHQNGMLHRSWEGIAVVAECVYLYKCCQRSSCRSPTPSSREAPSVMPSVLNHQHVPTVLKYMHAIYLYWIVLCSFNYRDRDWGRVRTLPISNQLDIKQQLLKISVMIVKFILADFKSCQNQTRNWITILDCIKLKCFCLQRGLAVPPCIIQLPARFKTFANKAVKHVIQKLKSRVPQVKTVQICLLMLTWRLRSHSFLTRTYYTDYCVQVWRKYIHRYEVLGN